MKTMTKPSAKRRHASKTRLTSRRGSLPGDLEKVDWDFRIDPPPPEKTWTVKARFIQGRVEPPVIRSDPRD